MPPTASLSTSLDGDKAVPCARSHGLETYAVVQARGSVARAAVLPTDALSAQANAVCVDTAGGNDAPRFLGSKVLDYTLVQEQAWGPTKAQWARGARWIRCDVSIQAEGLRAVTGTLRNALARPLTAADRFCVSGSGRSSRTVGCDRPHDYEDVGLPVLAGPFAPYPGDAAVDSRAASTCQSAARAYVGTGKPVTTHILYPRAKAWTGYGIRQVTCELALRAPRSGSLRGTGRLP